MRLPCSDSGCCGTESTPSPAYLRGILELGGGYTAAMAIPTPPELFARALLVSGGLAAALRLGDLHRRHEVVPVAALLLLAGHSFAQWKHSFVRSDGHAYIYFHYAVVAALTVHLAGCRRRSHVPAGWRRIRVSS